MAFQQSDLDTLDAAIAAGGIVSSMTFGEQTFSFRSVDDMLKLREVMARDVAATASTPTTRYAATSKGA